MTIERSNLLTVFKLVIKELIDSSLSHGRMLDDDHLPLQQFFVVLEHVLRHGIKRRVIGIFLDFISPFPFHSQERHLEGQKGVLGGAGAS